MHKKYYFGLGALLIVGILAVGFFVRTTPARAVDLRFTSFFDKFAPIQQVKADDLVETLSPLVPSQPTAIDQPISNDSATNNQPSAVCRVNDIEVPCPGVNNPAQPNQQNQQQGQQNQQQGQNGQFNQQGQQNQQGQPGQMGQQGQPGPNEEQMAKQQVQHLKEMKQAIKPLKNSIANFAKLMAKGNTLSDALQTKITQAKDLVVKIENAQTAEEISNDDMDTLRETMNDLQEEQQSMQRLTEFRSQIKNTERGVKNFETQLTRLQKQKLTIPTEVTENLNKMKQLITVVKTAKSWEEMQTAGVEDMGDLMQTLNESRNSLDMLARWPQTLKQMDKQITSFNSQVKKAKTIVDRLLKKDIDLTENYTKLTTIVDQLKVARADANTKMTAGDYEGAFSVAEDNFFGQLDEAGQNLQIISMMSNLGGFTSSFKSELNKAKQQINQLNKKKIDTTELQAIYDETKTKGEEAVALIKVKPIDQDAVQTALEDLGNLRMDFGDKVAELTGADVNDMPWQQGPQQFQAVQMNQNFNQYFPQQQQPISGGAGGQTCNINGVETPGPCQQ